MDIESVDVSKQQEMISILIVDNQDEFIDTFKLVLEANSTPEKVYNISVCYSFNQALDSFRNKTPDIIISDINLPGGSGLELCKRIRLFNRRKYTSFIIASTLDGPQEVVKSFNAGADDFCSKKNAWVELPARIKSSLRIKEMHESLLESNLKLRKANKKLKQLSDSDELTGLSNMRYFKKRFKQEFSRSKRYQTPLSLLMLDLDYFKNVNDDGNHLMGSHVLAEIGEIINKTLRNHDIGARFGGDEYVALLIQTTKEQAFIVAQRLHGLIENTVYRLDNFEARLTVSIGFAWFDPKNKNYEQAVDLMIDADKNLYRSKANGRACITGPGVKTEPTVDYSVVENRKIISLYQQNAEKVDEQKAANPDKPKKAL